MKNTAWVKTPVDNFVLAKLEAEQLEPAPPADKANGAPRQVRFARTAADTRGNRAFIADPSPDAFEPVVERLLASPAYGEKWGRNWLDVARYADSTGMDEDHLYPHAWRYRDYVIDAFNATCRTTVRHRAACRATCS